MCNQLLTKLIPIVFLSILYISCSSNQTTKEVNPPAYGFNKDASDSQAITIANEVMEAMGGRTAWDNTTQIKWTFFGRRTHLWDKKNNEVKIKVPDADMTYHLSMDDMTGSVKKGAEEIIQPDSLSKYLDQAYKMWINDSYWLVMPFKLKDSGVTLKYIGQDTTTTGENADVLELTFAEVGVTPDNKYHVYVNQENHLVTQWDYYANYQDSLPRFKSMWPNYAKYGDILLSGGQIGENKITNIEVGTNLNL